MRFNPRTLLRVYCWLISASLLLAVAFNATPRAVERDNPTTWEVIPSSCSTPLECTPNHPTR